MKTYDYPILARIEALFAGKQQIMPFFVYRYTPFVCTIARKKNRAQNIDRRRCCIMFKPKFRFTHDEVRIIVMALVELKNQLIAEGRYTDAVDDLLIKFVE